MRPKTAVIFNGQGRQFPGMFGELLNNPNPNIRRRAEEVLEDNLRRLVPEGSDIFDTYFNQGVDPLKINNTRYVQPGLTAFYLTLYLGFVDELGSNTPPDVNSGNCLGLLSSLYTGGVLSLSHDLNVAAIRGKSMPFEPGYFKVMSIKTEEDAHIRLINWNVLARTGWRVCNRLDTDVITLSGRLESRDKVEKKVKKIGRVIIPEDEDFDKKYHIPFHNCREMRPSANLFRHKLRRYCEKEEAETGEPVFKDLTGGRLFIPNGGKALTKGKDIMEYFSLPQIVKLCDFYQTMKRMGSLNPVCIGIGFKQRYLKRYSQFIQDSYEITGASDIVGAARWYDATMERRARELVPERVRRKLVPAYGHP